MVPHGRTALWTPAGPPGWGTAGDRRSTERTTTAGPPHAATGGLGPSGRQPAGDLWRYSHRDLATDRSLHPERSAARRRGDSTNGRHLAAAHAAEPRPGPRVHGAEESPAVDDL